MTLPRCPIFHLDKLMFFDAVAVGGMKLTQFEKIFPYTVFLMVKPSMLFFYATIWSFLNTDTISVRSEKKKPFILSAV